MSRLLARTIVVSLIVALGLPATPRVAAAQSSNGTELLYAYVAKLPVGSLVKVTPKEGRSFKGILMVVDRETVVIKPKTRIARPERQMRLADIDFVELQDRNGSGSTMKAVGIGVASAVGTFLGMLMIAVAISD